MSKTAIRAKALETRKGLLELESGAVFQKKSRDLSSRLSPFLACYADSVIYAFYPMRGEPDFAESLFRSGSKVALPKVLGETMTFFSCAGTQDLQIGKFGLMEPKGNTSEMKPKAGDVMLVPGLVLDMHGRRIGYGKGYYDRFFSQSGKDFLKVGICFEEFLEEDLPQDSHDVPVDIIITDRRVIHVAS